MVFAGRAAEEAVQQVIVKKLRGVTNRPAPVVWAVDPGRDRGAILIIVFVYAELSEHRRLSCCKPPLPRLSGREDVHSLSVTIYFTKLNNKSELREM